MVKSNGNGIGHPTTRLCFVHFLPLLWFLVWITLEFKENFMIGKYSWNFIYFCFGVLRFWPFWIRSRPSTIDHRPSTINSWWRLALVLVIVFWLPSFRTQQKQILCAFSRMIFQRSPIKINIFRPVAFVYHFSWRCCSSRPFTQV